MIRLKNVEDLKIENISYNPTKKAEKAFILVFDNLTVESSANLSKRVSIERILDVSTNQAYRLIVKVSFIVNAEVSDDEQSGETTDTITEQFFRRNPNMLGIPLSFISMLISQITGSFGQVPLITSTVLYPPMTSK